jgi:hypothetical protein
MKDARRRRKGRGSDADFGRNTSRRRGGRRRLLILLIVLGAVVALLPTIVVKTPLRDVLLSRLLPADSLQVTIGDASLGWFTPLSARAIAVRDAAGSELCTVESVRLDRSLFSLLTNLRNLGALEIARPALRVEVRADGSNVEDAIGKLAARFGGGESPPTSENKAASSSAISVKITEATILVIDAATKREWRAQDVNMQFESDVDTSKPPRFALNGQLSDSAAAAAAGRFTASLAPAGDGAAAGTQQLTWQIDGVSLASAAPWLRRVIAGAETAGMLSSQGTATWIADAGKAGPLPSNFTTSGSLSIDRLEATAPVLAGDRLRLSRVELPWRLTSQASGLLPQGLFIEELQLRSDIGQFAARGLIDPKSWSTTTSRAAEPVADDRHDVEIRGVIDLARLAVMLPRFLRIRSDTSITSGTIELAARRQPAVGGPVLTGSLRTVQLAATSAGRPLRWDEPIGATFAVRRAPGGLRLDSLTCKSEFLTVNASGSADQFTATAQFDLNRLAQQLGQFVDLNGIDLAGTGEARADWQLAGGTQFTASAKGNLTQVRVGATDGAAWAEPALELSAAASGALDPASQKMTQVTAANLQIVAQGDELNAQLANPVAFSTAAGQAPTEWLVNARATGSIARWLTRLGPFVDTAGWQVDGQSELTSNVRIAGSSIAATGTKLSITNLSATNPDWSIREPRVEFSGDASYDSSTGAFASNDAQLVTSTVALAAQNVRLAAGPSGGTQATGAIAFRTDLARLAAWRAKSVVNGTNPRDVPTPVYFPTGRISGNVGISQQAGRVRAELTATGEDLALSQATRAPDGRSIEFPQIWQEPKLVLRGVADHDLAADRLTIDQLQVQSNTIAATMDGRIERLSTAAETNLNGTVNYDLAQLSPLLRPYLGDGIRLNGREQARFALAGKLGESWPNATTMPASLALDSQPSTLNPPHWSRRIQARLDLPWSGANIYGLPIGGGRIAAALADGGVRIDPLSLAVAEGRLTAAPQVRLDPAPSELTLPAGPLLEGVRISPEISETMLKYIAPVLAGATDSQGHFSLALAGARVPLEQPRQADIGGHLTVHQVRVVPGEMARQWIGLAKQIEGLTKGGNPLALGQQPAAPTNQREVTLLSIRDQQVNFRVVEGRVHHQNMEFQVDDVVLRSQGWVAFDETISLILTVPIQDRWIEKQRFLAGLRGQSLQIPITGTLRQPRMDESAIANLSGQLLQGAAGQAVGNELNRALDKLFKPRQEQ